MVTLKVVMVTIEWCNMVTMKVLQCKRMVTMVAEIPFKI